MIAKILQRDIEAIYKLDQCPSVDQFLVTSDEIKQLVPDQADPRPQVLFKEEDGEVSLAVHLGDRTIERIETNGISQNTLSDFLSAAEEISHFVYLSWSAKNLRPVSLLDVELQGEIDKFLLAKQYFSGHERLFERLFEWIAYHDQLGLEEAKRYVEANRLGGKFVKSLGDIFDGNGPRPEVLAQLRSFYRQASSTRLSKIDRL